MNDGSHSAESTGQTSTEQAVERDTKPLTPLRCLVGAAIAAPLSFAMYRMTSAIAVSFATNKIHSDSLIVQRISAAVRTLVIGMTALGTGVFGLAALGLSALAVQLVFQQLKQKSAPPTN
ncbi:MAG: DUF3082 domain-containing protein [Leptolyngbyaceae cyanobacterium RU_5_1]|nr:DUF3082 domain-containing protein [Leptolyngbyaceae cyanobacterium RU_5_1]